MLYQLSYFRISSYLSGHLLRWTSYRQSVIYSSKLPLSSLVRLESDRPYTPVFSSGRLLRWTSPELWEKMDSNHRRYKPADLQSAPFGHSGIRPVLDYISASRLLRADRGIRTHDPEITNHVLWPTELYRQKCTRPTFQLSSGCKVRYYFLSTKIFGLFFYFPATFFLFFSS